MIAEAANRLLNALFAKYMLTYREVLRLVHPELIHDVLAYIVRNYSYKYDIRCENYAEPVLSFYGVKPPSMRRPNYEELIETCRRVADRMIDQHLTDMARRMCSDRIVLLKGRWFVKVTDRLVVDDTYIYIYSNGRLRKNMRWRIVYDKYRTGYENTFVKWFGRKIDEIKPCIKLLQDYYTQGLI